MKNTVDHKVKSLLIGIMSDGFNRSISALEKAGAINTQKMRKEYNGIGSKYYDIVTKELEYTAEYAAKPLVDAILEEIEKDKN